MKNKVLIFLITFGVVSSAAAPVKSFDEGINALALNLKKNIPQSETKAKLAVIDLTDLQGNVNDLGRFAADQLSVSMVIVRSNYTVLDRQSLKKILEEHKLTASGLVEAENQKKLGQFSGADFLVLGTVTRLGSEIAISSRLISIVSAEIIGAAKERVQSDEQLSKLASIELVTTAATTSTPEKQISTAKHEMMRPPASRGSASKDLEKIRVELKPFLQSPYRATTTMKITNFSEEKLLLVLNNDQTLIIDDAGNQCQIESAVGIGHSSPYTVFGQVAQKMLIAPGDSGSAVLTFRTSINPDSAPKSKDFHVALGILLFKNGNSREQPETNFINWDSFEEARTK